MGFSRFVVRVIPSGLSLLVTVLIIRALPQTGYGEYSYLLANANLLNSVIFHSSRNLIVYEKQYNISRQDLSGAWILGLGISPLVIIGAVGLGFLTPWYGLLVFGYLFCQSYFERKIEFSRSSIDLKRFLIVTCGRPIWSLLFVVSLTRFLPESNSLPVQIFALVSLAALLAAGSPNRLPDSVPRMRLADVLASIKTLPLGVLITISSSYLFLSDAITKIALKQISGAYALGGFSKYVDLILPGTWVIASAVAWSMVPSLVRSRQCEKYKSALSWLKRSLAPFCAVTCALLLAKHSAAFIVGEWQFSTVAGVALYTLSGAYLSCILFPMLIVLKRPACAALQSAALLLGIFAFVLMANRTDDIIGSLLNWAALANIVAVALSSVVVIHAVRGGSRSRC